jgi:hypothetical protein
VSDPHSHRLIRAYEEGRAAFRSIFHNPYADTGDLSAARMAGFGRQHSGKEARGAPTAALTEQWLREQLAEIERGIDWGQGHAGNLSASRLVFVPQESRSRIVHTHSRARS